MNHPRPIAAIALLASIVAIGWTGTRYAAARRERSRAEVLHDRIASDAAEIARLRTSRSAIAAAARPQPNLSGQVNDVLVEAALSPAVLTSLTPEPDAPVNPGSAPTSGRAATYRRQTARLTLDPLTMPDLGRFLSSWSKGQPDWTVASITITPGTPGVPGTPITPAIHAKPSGAGPDTADDPRDLTSPSRKVRVTLTLECLYVDRPATVSPSTSTP